MDEAFIPLHEMVLGMAATGDIRSDERGIHMYVERLEIESPIELDLTVRSGGSVEIGSVPPLYRVDTSVLPSFHKIRFTAELTGGALDG
jgi:hypothetical protein